MSAPAVKVTTLCENSVGGGRLLGEHGLALLLEVKKRKILFDTGAGLTLVRNAQALGVGLASLDAVVLSHGHADHTGGLLPLVESAGPLPVYAHPDVFGPRYLRNNEKNHKYIGVPWMREELVHKGVQFCLNRGRVHLGDGVTLTGEIPRFEQNEAAGEQLCLKTRHGLVKDPHSDDQAVIVESPLGLIVLLGCAHAGLINTLRYVLQLTGERQIYAVLGGTHLLDLPQKKLNKTVELLQNFGLQKIAPCHCTGMAARFALYQAFGSRYLEHRAGSVFCF